MTCSFDETFLNQPPGLLAAVSAHINGENPSNRKIAFPKLPDWVKDPPPLVRPMTVNSNGFDGPVPLPFSFSWQKYSPFEGPGKCSFPLLMFFEDATVQFASSEEPDVLVVVLQNQVLKLLEVFFNFFLWKA